MGAQTGTGRFLIEHRRSARAVVLVFAVLALAAPLLVVGLSAGHFAGGKAVAIRLLGLYAFTFAFFNVMTGALAPRFGTDVSASTTGANVMMSIMIVYLLLAVAATAVRQVDRRRLTARGHAAGPLEREGA